MSQSALLLMAWLSPSFPVGAFAYSHGLEWAVDSGLIKDAATLRHWLDDLIAHGPVRNDCILLAQAWHAVNSQDSIALNGVNDLALALSPTRERRLETSQQGGSFLSAVDQSWPAPRVAFARDTLTGPIAYPIAVGAAANAHDIDVESTASAFAFAFVGALVSAAVRLGPIGQTDGQKTLAHCTASVSAVAQFACSATLDDLGGAAFLSDIASMRHETQYSRLFRS